MSLFSDGLFLEVSLEKNVLFFQSQHVSGICMSHMYYSMDSLNVFVAGVGCLLSCLIPDGVVCEGEPSLTSKLSCILCVGHSLSTIPAA